MAIAPEQLEELIRRLAPPRPVKHFTRCTARFDGTRTSEAVESFVSSADFYKASEDISDANAIQGLQLLLQGPAHTWWTGVKDSIQTWAQAREAIRNEFAPCPPAYKIYLEVFATKQIADVPTGLFVAQKRALLAKIEPADSEARQIDFIYGLLRMELKDRIPRSTVQTFPALLTAAREAEDILKERRQEIREPLKPLNVHRQERSRVRCDYCRNTGHDSTKCRRKERDEAARRNRNTYPPTSNGIRCYGCGTPGVIRKNCSKCTAQRTQQEAPTLAFRAMEVETVERPALEITIAGATGTAYLDSGARTSLASPGLWEILKKKNFAFETSVARIVMADGVSQTRVVQTTMVPVMLKGRTIRTPFVCTDSGPDAVTLLGVDFAQLAGLVVNYKTGTYHFHGSRHENYHFVRKETQRSLPVTSVDLAMEQDGEPEAEDFTEMFASTEWSNLMSSHGPLLSPLPATPPHVHQPCVYVPEEMDPDVKEFEEMFASDVWSNLTNNYGPLLSPLPTTPPRVPQPPIHVPERLPLGPVSNENPSRTDYMWNDAVYSIDVLYGGCSPGTPSLFPRLDLASLDLRTEDEGHALNEEQKQELNALIRSHQDSFAEHGPATPHVEHRIDTGSHLPLSSPPYRISPQKQRILQAEIDQLLTLGIIEECESAWASPIVLVPKPGGKVRLCVDYRKLNAVTKPDVYPLPRLEDLLHSTGGANFLSTIDLKAGYYQILVAREDRDKTAFITPFGVYRFNRLPFGLRNAPATFQRLIDRLKTKVTGTTLLAYLDDLIILSPTAARHIADLSNVFSKLRELKLRMNRAKCRFACTEVKYLGHIISPKGIQTDPGKVQAIRNMGVPRSVKHVQSFLQTCSWYRKFIPEFANISRPISDLTKKNAPFVWGPAQNEAYTRLKDALTTAPILKQADHTSGYTLRTDASSYALGAALLQGEGREERPIEYASRLLTPAERNYSTTEREALAIVWSAQKFRAYLEEAPSIVITDHQPLLWLMKMKSPSGRLARWALQLQPFNLTIRYVPGKANTLADALSRPPCEEGQEPACPMCIISVDLPSRSSADTREGQLQDPEVKKIVNCLETGTPEETSQWSSRGYLMNQGVLYRYSQDDDTEEAQLVIPSQETDRILKESHDSPTAGHYGATHTLQKIRRQYYWPGMRKDVTQYVKNCTACQRYKPTNLKPAGLLQTPVLKQRFEVLAIDLFGPLPETPTGERWVFIIEDYATKWVELFPLKQATSQACAYSLVNEVFLRYGLPRRIISDNGTQFISGIMQQVTFCFNIDHRFTPVYHPSANPVERKNRELKTQLSILVGTQHDGWLEKLPSIRFAMNSTPCQSTGFSPAYLNFGRELRTATDVFQDLRQLATNENFIPEITPHLIRIADTLQQARETQEGQQDRQKQYADSKRRLAPTYQPGDEVWVTTHPLSQASKKQSGKFAPKRDGPYIIVTAKGPCSYEIASPTDPANILGVYHTSALAPYHAAGDEKRPEPVRLMRRRGRPRKHTAKA